jgi:hypothetical protein
LVPLFLACIYFQFLFTVRLIKAQFAVCVVEVEAAEAGRAQRGWRAQSVYTLGEFWVPEIYERGRESRSLATTGARV